MDQESIFYQSNINLEFNKNLHTFINTEYKYIKNIVKNKIEIYLEINNIINSIINNINE